MDKATRETLMQTLNGVPKNEWPRIWSELVFGNWPEELGQKPGVDEGVCSVDRFYCYVIERDCGLKACFRYMNTKLSDMPDDVFEEWWNSGLTFDEYISKPSDKLPERIRQKCATNDGKRSNHPIMRKLLSSLGAFLRKLDKSGST